MKDDSWLAALDSALRARGVGAVVRSEALVELEGFLADSGSRAIDQFGTPAAYAEAMVDALGPGTPRRGPRDEPPLLEGRALTKSYRRTSVLREVTIELRPGELVALIGSNGAGKSTLLRLLAGLEDPDRGTVRRACSVGYVPQTGGIDPYLRPVEHFELFGAMRGLSRGESRHQGRRFARELGWDVTGSPLAGELSGGTRQKLAVITALLGEPQVLLLDEPYQGMDARSTERFWELLWSMCDQGAAAAVSSHDGDVLARATTVVELEGDRRAGG